MGIRLAEKELEKIKWRRKCSCGCEEKIRQFEPAFRVGREFYSRFCGDIAAENMALEGGWVVTLEGDDEECLLTEKGPLYQDDMRAAIRQLER